MPLPALFRRSARTNQEVVGEFLRLISLGGMLHQQRTVTLSKEDKDYFDRAFALLRDGDPEQVWYLVYALQVTQDRREIDALHTEQVLALGYGAAGVLLILWAVAAHGALTPFALATCICVGAVAVVAALRYAIEAKRKRVLHLLALFIQQFTWGDFADIQDREAT